MTTKRGITLITADGIRHNILVALVGDGISISRDAQGRMVINATGGPGTGEEALQPLLVQDESTGTFGFLVDSGGNLLYGYPE